jgi:carotenoid 1,2-hydratase
VFSAGYFAERARLGVDAADPERYCALNVAIYGGANRRWVLTEHPRAAIHRTPDHFALDRSTIRWEGDALVIDIVEQSAIANLPVRGRVRLHPAQIHHAPVVLDPAARHRWWAIAPRARIEVELDAPRLRFRGSGYHDSNFGDGPLEGDFHDWWWSRAELASGTAVLYDARVRGEASARRLGWRFADDGRVEPIEVPQVRQLRRTLWWMPRELRHDAGARHVGVVRTLEDAPFYSRSWLRTELLGEQVHAMHESLSLDRFRSPVVQWMLPYKTRRADPKALGQPAALPRPAEREP